MVSKNSDVEPEFWFKGNKKQKRLNKNLVEKISSAMDTTDNKERNNVLCEDEALLLELHMFASKIRMTGAL